MVFQEVTPEALAVFLDEPWIRVRYRRAAVTGRRRRQLRHADVVEDSRWAASPTLRLPTQLARGFLTAELDAVDGRTLDRGGRDTPREWQGGVTGCAPGSWDGSSGALRRAESASRARRLQHARLREPAIISRAVSRPLARTSAHSSEGFTEDTSINLMRYDSKNKHRQVRFDRVLLKGGGWAATSIELLGTEPISSALPRVFPSDHFGVICRLERREASPRHQRHWPIWRH